MSPHTYTHAHSCQCIFWQRFSHKLPIYNVAVCVHSGQGNKIERRARLLCSLLQWQPCITNTCNQYAWMPTTTNAPVATATKATTTKDCQLNSSSATSARRRSGAGRTERKRAREQQRERERSWKQQQSACAAAHLSDCASAWMCVCLLADCIFTTRVGEPDFMNEFVGVRV